LSLAIVIDIFDRIQVQDQGIGELRAIVKVDEKLDWLDVVSEIFYEQVSYSPENPWHSIQLESLDEQFMIHSDRLRHYICDCLPYNLFFRNAKNLTSDLVAICEAACNFVIFVGKNSECEVINIRVTHCSDSCILFSHVPHHDQVFKVAHHLIVLLLIIQ